MSLSKEIRQDILEFFPTILSKEVYFKLIKEIHLPIEQEVLINDIYQKEYRWKVSFSILKRLDSIDHDWNIMPLPLLHYLPDLYLEQPITLFCDTVNKWNYIEKLKYFPMIKTIDVQQNHVKSKQKKIAASQALVTRLNLLDKLTVITKPVISNNNNNNNNDMIILNNNNNDLIEITTTKYKSQFNNFLPKKKLDDYKAIQTCLKDKRRTKRVCELDNFRFQFD